MTTPSTPSTPSTPGVPTGPFAGHALKTGVAATAATAALFNSSAAEAKASGLKAQADALRAAAAERQAQHKPAAVSLDANYDTAKGLLASGDIAGAMAGFRRVLAAEPQSVDAMNGLAITYDRMGRHDVARGWYEAALAVKPDAGSVLSNLGYSLYLQGEYREAIPFLHAALRSNDRMAMATAQRLLSLVNASILAQAATANAPLQTAAIQPATTEIAVATIAPAPKAEAPQPKAAEPKAAPAHIELASNGEARLVLGGPAPAPQLVAALGDAATLVLVAERWTSEDDQKLVQQDFAAEQLVARQEAAAAARARIETAALVTIAQPVARLVFTRAEDLRFDQPLIAERVVAAAAAPEAPAPAAAPAPAPIRLALPHVSLEAMAVPLLPAAPTASRDQRPVWQNSVDNVSASLAVDAAPDMLPEASPGWLLAVRRSAPGGTAPAPAAPMLLLGADGAVHAFESDDALLNSFAARRRTAAPEDSPAARQAAISRLEALIARVRQMSLAAA
jgi:Flp pilus assembly protein TadD